MQLFVLALLGLATAHVFVYDLASLHASYRVLSFVGLGALLLASSYAYGHMRTIGGRGFDAGAVWEAAGRGMSRAAEAGPFGHDQPME